jgi:outer membrane receptor protein involved in Fe transport
MRHQDHDLRLQHAGWIISGEAEMLQIRSDRKHLAGGAALIALTMGLCTAAPAFAQSEPAQSEPAATAQDAAQEEPLITVTGSRIERSGFNSPTPLTVMDSTLIADLGQTNVSETLKLIPQNTSFQSDAVSGITAGANVGASFANLRGLNPFFGTRTLTLVNTRRFIPTSDGGAVDLNVIPAAMIKRVETVTGGASAAYGSDAIAGVVNIILENEFEGFKAQADYGQTSRGDGKTWHASLMWGTRLGDRGHFLIGGEYQKQDGIGDCAKVREWCAEGWDVFTNASVILPGGGTSGYNVPGSPGDSKPNFVVGPNSKQAYNDPRGVVRDRAPAANPARNFRFNDAGTGIIQFDPGIYVSSSLTGPRQGGDGASTYDDSDLQTPLKRYVGYAYGEYEIFDNVKLVGELNYANRTASNVGVTVGPRSTFFVKPTNPFLPASLVTLLAGTSFSLGKDLDGQIESLNRAKAEVWRGMVGLNGTIGSNWRWDTYFQYGKNNRHQDRTNNRVNTPFQYALDAAVGPGGTIVCAELLNANPNPLAVGCKPLNLFGIGNLDPAAVAYAYRPVVEDFKYSQKVFAASMNGTLFDGWGAGPIGLAFGAEYRAESGDVTHGNIPNYNDYAFTFGLDYAGKINVAEGFAEVNVPVFRNSMFGDYFELNGAIRYTRNHAENTLSGEEKTSKATSWKLSGVYDVFDGVRLRASRSRDIRAAGFRELFLRNVPTDPGTSTGIVDNPNIPGAPASGDDPTPILNGGSFALSPETADTTTGGFVFSPSFMKGFRFSADWYQIKIRDAVTTLTGQRIVDFCSQFQLFCDRITFASPTNITFVDARQVNLGAMTLRGIDFELDYRLKLSDVSAPMDGTLGLRVLANHQYDFIVQPNRTVPARDYAGQSGPVVDAGDFNPAPPWIWTGFLSYDTTNFNATMSVRRISKGILNVERKGPEDAGYDPNAAGSISTNRVSGATYFGLAMTYKIPFGSGGRDYVEIFGVADNIFDKKPPVAPGGGSLGGSNYPTNPVYFDTFGSRYKAGVRVRF